MEGEELADDPIMHMHKDLCMGSSRIDRLPLMNIGSRSVIKFQRPLRPRYGD